MKDNMIKSVGSQNKFLEVISIDFHKDDNDESFKEKVFDRFENTENRELHSFGEGPFCRFSIDKKWKNRSGVYAFVVDERPRYIGSTVNLFRTINNDIGRISPSACYIDGQSTNCRINHSILNEIENGKDVILIFYETDNTKELKSKYMDKYKPDWNLRL